MTIRLKDLVDDADPALLRVLDKGFVKLIDFMPSTWPAGESVEGATPGDLAVVAAARVSYGTVSKGPEADRKLIHYLITHGHTSPLEMVEFKFLIKAPVVMWWQHVRHRHQELNFESGRYRAYPEDEFYLPERLRAQDSVNKQGSVLSDFLIEEEEQALLAELRAHYEAGQALYRKLLTRGVAKEMARLALPGFALYHSAYVKMNAHALIHYLAKRNHPDAQYEIRAYAEVMERIFAEKLPWTYSAWRGNVNGAAD